MNQLALFGGRAIRTRPFPSWPVWDQNEERALLEVLHSGKWWRYAYGRGVELEEPEPGSGHTHSRVVAFQDQFARHQQARYGIACANGTAALELALKAMGVGPGDEVIVPAYTFVATATAVLMVNAVPIFADIELDTFNIDPKRVEDALSPNTKAIIPVHFAGQAADMDAVLAVARRHSLLVLEDAAQAHGAAWNGRGLGSIGNAGTFSFQASKNMTAGEGGVILTNDERLAHLAESYLWAGREFGRPWYEHFRLGWNYRMTEFQAAILLEQLKRLAAQNTKRRQSAEFLSRRLAEIPGIHPLAIRKFTTKHSFHLYIFCFDKDEFGLSREDFLAALNAEGVPAIGGYAHPLYRNPMFLNQDFYPRGCPLTCGHYAKPVDYGSFKDACPNAESACRDAVWLEHRLLLAEREDLEDIAGAVRKIYEQRHEFITSSAKRHN